MIYAGEVVEYGEPRSRSLTIRTHPYTEGLFGSHARHRARTRSWLRPIDGLPPDPTDLPEGCSFRPALPVLRPSECRDRGPIAVHVDCETAMTDPVLQRATRCEAGG